MSDKSRRSRPARPQPRSRSKEKRADEGGRQPRRQRRHRRHAPQAAHQSTAWRRSGIRERCPSSSARGVEDPQVIPTLAPWNEPSPQCFGGLVTHAVEADYLVVGAGATGMAFTTTP